MALQVSPDASPVNTPRDESRSLLSNASSEVDEEEQEKKKREAFSRSVKVVFASTLPYVGYALLCVGALLFAPTLPTMVAHSLGPESSPGASQQQSSGESRHKVAGELWVDRNLRKRTDSGKTAIADAQTATKSPEVAGKVEAKTVTEAPVEAKPAMEDTTAKPPVDTTAKPPVVITDGAQEPKRWIPVIDPSQESFYTAAGLAAFTATWGLFILHLGRKLVWELESEREKNANQIKGVQDSIAQAKKDRQEERMREIEKKRAIKKQKEQAKLRREAAKKGKSIAVANDDDDEIIKIKKKEYSEFFQAAMKGDVEGVKFWVSEKVVLDHLEYGQSALHLAVYYGQIGTVKALVEAKADINMTNHEYETPLQVALSNGQISVPTTTPSELPAELYEPKSVLQYLRQQGARLEAYDFDVVY
eukprot:TRINITY_DN17018_c0_g1_i1.p1 TRINITY_DN17018_c0_g1~~TRINITY_DN17018_c0_g1_i1.p1  ORF type:complete len:436 (-),score=95.03 TRINITY_DN17018_c0_g1_i1:79-1335(-)